jgi:hypothetical protein
MQLLSCKSRDRESLTPLASKEEGSFPPMHHITEELPKWRVGFISHCHCDKRPEKKERYFWLMVSEVSFLVAWLCRFGPVVDYTVWKECVME